MKKRLSEQGKMVAAKLFSLTRKLKDKKLTDSQVEMIRDKIKKLRSSLE